MTNVSGIVLELRQAACDSSVAVSDLLRRALRVASELKVLDQAPWIQSESEGYLEINGNYDLIPSYRFLTSKLDQEIISPSGNCIGYRDPFTFGLNPSDPIANTEVFPCHVPIPEIENILEDEHKNSFVHVPCQPDLEIYYKEDQRILAPSAPTVLTLQASTLRSILDAVRNRILDWASQLDEKCISGGNLSFSDEPTNAERADIVDEPPAKTGAGEPQKPTKKRAYTPWPKTAQKAVGELWVSFRRNGGTREEDCYEEHKAAARLPVCIKSIDDFRKCKEAAEKQALIPRLHQKRGKAKGKTCQ